MGVLPIAPLFGKRVFLTEVPKRFLGTSGQKDGGLKIGKVTFIFNAVF